jgi:hypothetical protein
MAGESLNGSTPADGASDPDAEGTDAYERFERLTRLLVTVPKEDVEREGEREKRKAAKR